MKTVKRRAAFALVLAAALLAGLAIYISEQFARGDQWVMLRANQSVFNQGVLDTGTLTDRNGVVLAHAGDGVFAYADDQSVRTACLHAVGDYGGNFGTGALSVMADRLTGYSFINGVAGLDEQGSSVKLSLDSSLNVAAYAALAGRRGTVMVQNYKTGEILCMVSSPSYDPNTPPDTTQSQYEGVYLNRGLSASFTPGSVFKLVTLSAALENIPDIYERSFNCQGSCQVGADTVTCTGVHGQQTIEQALANSCNCAFSEISQQLGPQVIYDYVEKYGFLEELDISGARTLPGSFEKPREGTSDLSWSGIGQFNDLVTPVSMLRYVSAIANGGTAKEPTLIKGGHSGHTVLMDSAQAEKISDMMNYNVAYTYGKSSFPGLEICAKTGTAEVGDGSSHSWITGFLLDGEHPYAFVVMIERGGGGLANAGPVANAVLQAAVTK